MKTKLMGILNVTPDSYFDGGKYFDHTLAIKHGIKLSDEGADIIDIGGFSSRPVSQNAYGKASEQINANEELQRVLPVIQALKKEIKTPLSIDTFRPLVAQAALDAGVDFINDVTGFRDVEMLKLAKEYQKPICIMHMQKDFQTMQINPKYENGVINDIVIWFKKRIEEVISFGIDQNLIYIDPGIGFGKTLEDNFKILQDLEQLEKISFPLVLGTSRKFFLQKTLNKTPKDALSATLGINTYLMLKNVDILRVHDVEAHKDILKVLSKLTKE